MDRLQENIFWILGRHAQDGVTFYVSKGKKVRPTITIGQVASYRAASYRAATWAWGYFSLNTMRFLAASFVGSLMNLVNISPRIPCCHERSSEHIFDYGRISGGPDSEVFQGFPRFRLQWCRTLLRTGETERSKNE
jgi:hypothetical protein